MGEGYREADHPHRFMNSRNCLDIAFVPLPLLFPIFVVFLSGKSWERAFAYTHASWEKARRWLTLSYQILVL